MNNNTNNASHLHTNKLINEQSPYLLQHAHNPVDWYPWGKEAFEKAKDEDKPIFLSIGYSTCHWCHVMERESFEDTEAAQILNDKFVSIKVDREERPDVDHIYMNVCQLFNNRGGWPLSIIMTPNKEPFFAGTYFPKTSSHGRIGFIDLLLKVDELWQKEREELVQQGNKITTVLSELNKSENNEDLSSDIFNTAFHKLSDNYDEQFGGFGDQPKFPSPHNLLFLLRYWYVNKNTHALDMVINTLTNMRTGGIYDHVGYGFHRYSTDKQWVLPHFEKMLYDQAMLIHAYTEAYQITKNILFKKTVEEIFEYVKRDMTSPEGGFYSAEDADSEGEEGKFYVWNLNELKEILTKEELNFLIDNYNVHEDGNFVDEATRTYTGSNILYPKDEKQSSDPIFVSIRSKLFEKRRQRVHPSKDDKILTDWNGLMLSALSKASSVFNNKEMLHAAINDFEFINSNLFTGDRLLHRYRNGKAGIDAMLDDYSFLIWGLIELYEASFDPMYLKKAIELLDVAIDIFYDDSDGGFYFNHENQDDLIVRSKQLYDGAIPSGNSIMLLNLVRIYKITNKEKYKNVIDKFINFSAQRIKEAPNGFTMFLSGYDLWMNPSFEIVFVDSENSNGTNDMIDFVRSEFLPNKIVLYLTDSEKFKNIREIAEYTNTYKAIDKKLTAYVCKNYECSLPVKTFSKFLNQIRSFYF